MALACFLFPLLYLISAFYYLTDHGEFMPAVYSWISSRDPEILGFRWLAGIAAIPAWLGAALLLKNQRPRLAFWSTVFVYVGGLSQAAVDRVGFELALLRQLGFDIHYNTTMEVMGPIGFYALTVLLWMIEMVMLGIGFWRTGLLPKWASVALALAGPAYFAFQGPPTTPTIPLIAYQLAGLCFLLAFPLIGWRLWRSAAD
jgi:hypothetical protein